MNLKKENFSVSLVEGELKKLIESAISILSKKNKDKFNNKKLGFYLKEKCRSLQNLKLESLSDNYLTSWKYRESFIPLDCLEELCKLIGKNLNEFTEKIEKIKLTSSKNTSGIPIKYLADYNSVNGDRIEKEQKVVSLPGYFRVIINTYRKPNHQFELVIYNSQLAKKIEEIGKNDRNLTRAVVKFIDERTVMIKKDFFGNLLNPYPASQTLRISVGNFLPRDRKNKITKEFTDKKFGLRMNVLINPEDWNFSTLDRFLESKKNTELAKELLSLNYNVFPITANDPNKLKYGIPDLVLGFKKFKIPIEITSIQPTKLKVNSKRPNAPHGSTWTRISGRILPIFLYGLENNTPTFIIVNKKWKKYKHCIKLVKKLKKFNCFIFFSNFQGDWSKEVVMKIDETLKSAQYDLPWY